MSKSEFVFASGLNRVRLEKRFKNCCDCGVGLTQDNVSTHQPIRCQECLGAFFGRTEATFKALAGGKGEGA